MIQLNSAASSLKQLQYRMDTIAHNLSNLDTTAYKRQDVLFSDALNNAMTMQAGRYEAGRQTPNGIRIGNGVINAGTATLNEQGSIKTTNRSYDIALMEKSIYFTVQAGGENYFTRSGNLDIYYDRVTDRNYLQASGGARVLDVNGQPIQFDNDYSSLEITDQGVVIGRFKNPAKPPVAFNLDLTRIDRPSTLVESGNSRYQFVGNQATMTAEGSYERLIGEQRSNLVLQGSIEQSNVDLTAETAEMIATQRLIQSTSRALSFADDMRGLINTINR